MSALADLLHLFYFRFDFSSALTDVPTFIATARVLEVRSNASRFRLLCFPSLDLTAANALSQYVGTSAYLGASTIIDDKAVLISAGTSGRLIWKRPVRPS